MKTLIKILCLSVFWFSCEEENNSNEGIVGAWAHTSITNTEETYSYSDDHVWDIYFYTDSTFLDIQTFEEGEGLPDELILVLDSTYGLWNFKNDTLIMNRICDTGVEIGCNDWDDGVIDGIEKNEFFVQKLDNQFLDLWIDSISVKLSFERY